MDPPGFMVRRATVDDLGGLKTLWERARLPVFETERHLTEFQLVVSEGGDLIGAIGLHIEGKHGQLHSEAFAEPEHEDEFRPQLWERLKTVARNHGLTRLWTQEASPFWHQSGFQQAGPELLQRLPSSFGDRHVVWLTLQLKEESGAALSLEREFELFQQSQREATEQMLRQAGVFKVLAWVLILGFLVIVCVVIFRMVLKSAPGS